MFYTQPKFAYRFSFALKYFYTKYYVLPTLQSMSLLLLIWPITEFELNIQVVLAVMFYFSSHDWLSAQAAK